MRPSGIKNRFRLLTLKPRLVAQISWRSSVVHNCWQWATQTKITVKLRDVLQADLSSPDDADGYASSINP